jgi:5-methylcytosine-specific restriction endonuclease McrA
METMDLTAQTTIDRLEQMLIGDETQIARLRARQIAALQALDLAQVPMIDGSRTLTEWAAARIDLTPETARTLTQTARRLAEQPDLATELQQGVVSFDRVAEESRLIATGASPDLVTRSRGWDLTGLRRVTARHQRITRRDEQQAFADRSIMIQPTLDQTFYKIWGGLPGVDGRTLEQALTQKADQFPALPDDPRSSRAQRNADALVAIAQDSLNGNQTEGTTSGPVVSIFVDAHLAASTNGETGAEIASGPRVGPLTLEQILCHGSVEILMTAPDGTPLVVGPTSKTIPPKLKRFILHRDGGACTADGCQSRYRLQPHHITPKSQGGSHDPHNLTTLCWFHHHVVIHRNGYHINPNSPPQRRRFLKPEGRDPP